MSTGPGPLSQADVDAIEDRLADVDEHPGADDPLLIHHDELTPT
jgi:hypothetical protein